MKDERRASWEEAEFWFRGGAVQQRSKDHPGQPPLFNINQGDVMAENLQLGDRVKYKIDGFEGIVTGITVYLQQCRQVLVTPEKLDKEGKPLKAAWYDEPWVDLIKSGVHAPKAAVETAKGRWSGAPNREHPPARQ